ncbi:Flp pilus assembly complex ATPase component TadA [Planctomycetales bacterium ZRK34]|nr:Flp pilus assembly complex ATPase component TadA [Planctomycetales bacterium ZRK34]
MGKSRKKLGEYLLRWEVISQQQLDEALKVASGSRKRIGQVLVELGYASEDDVARALASQFNLEYIDLDAANAVTKENLELMPRDLMQKYLVLPLDKSGGRLKVLLHDPLNLDLLDTLRFRMNCEIDYALGARNKIKEYIDRFVRDTQSSIDDVREASIDSATFTIEGGETGEQNFELDSDEGTGGVKDEEAADSPIIRLVHRIIGEAVNSRASDIHVEPMSDRVRLRYRIDGVCHERDNIPKRTQAPIITRLKIMAGMKIDERRIPQDGRIKLRIGGKQIDFRVSACPSYHGESMVLRILRPDSVKIGLAAIGFEPDTLENFDRAIRRPNGIFLVTGPTGSGKTTTLYSALDVLNRPDRKIITAEDPVEYNFAGINQCQVRDEIGLTFPNILRAMLRQAPNIILVGEIRDKDVADVAIQAALTGHLVFSTLHTNDAPSAITRLIDMGVKPFLVASSIQAVMAQRLIRTLCKDCKEPDDDPNPFYLKLIGINPSEIGDKTIYRAVGCPACANTGYRGRKAIFEWMTMNTQLRELAFARASSSQLRSAAVNSGMRTLASDGRIKVLNGVTSAEEIARVAQIEGMVNMDEEQAGDAA